MRKKRLSEARKAERAAAREAKRQSSAMAGVEELAQVLGVGLNQAYAAVQMGKVPAVRFGRRWLISARPSIASRMASSP
jgi:excisionase family DNA binding protein